LALNQTQKNDGKWLILYVLDQPCDQACIEKVTALRQIHRAMGRNNEHLAIALISDKLTELELRSKLETIYPEFVFIVDSSQTALAALKAINADLPAEKVEPDDVHTYILDPNYNVILAYQTSVDPTGIHKDLKRLLKWSDKGGK